MKTTQDHLKKVRSDLKFFADLVDTEFERNRYTALAITALEKSSMFIGNTIKELNEGVSPYVHSENPLNDKIDPYHIDVNIELVHLPGEWKELSYTQKVKWARLMIELRLDMLRMSDREPLNGWAIATFVYAQISALEGKNWLGMELGRIRDARS